MPSAKLIHKFSIKKNELPSGAWLASMSVQDSSGHVTVTHFQAWSSAAPAKRWAAGLVDRSRLTWDVSEDKKSMTAELEVKV